MRFLCISGWDGVDHEVSEMHRNEGATQGTLEFRHSFPYAGHLDNRRRLDNIIDSIGLYRGTAVNLRCTLASTWNRIPQGALALWKLYRTELN